MKIKLEELAYAIQELEDKNTHLTHRMQNVKAAVKVLLRAINVSTKCPVCEDIQTTNILLGDDDSC